MAMAKHMNQKVWNNDSGAYNPKAPVYISPQAGGFGIYESDDARCSHLLPSDLQAHLDHIVYGEDPMNHKEWKEPECSEVYSNVFFPKGSAQAKGRNKMDVAQDVNVQQIQLHNFLPPQRVGLVPPPPPMSAGADPLLAPRMDSQGTEVSWTAKQLQPADRSTRQPPQQQHQQQQQLQLQQQNQAAISPAEMAELHKAGECRPCLYLNSKASCLYGFSCRFCHMPHPKKNRPRPCKAKRTQCKQIVNMLHTVFTEDSREFQEASLRLSSESSYMRSILGGKQSPSTGKPGEENASAQPEFDAKDGNQVCSRRDLGALFGESAASLLAGGGHHRGRRAQTGN